MKTDLQNLYVDASLLLLQMRKRVLRTELRCRRELVARNRFPGISSVDFLKPIEHAPREYDGRSRGWSDRNRDISVEATLAGLYPEHVLSRPHPSVWLTSWDSPA